MSNSDFKKWLDEKIKELLRAEVQVDGEYKEEIIREYLIFAQYEKFGEVLMNFFSSNKADEKLLKLLIDILLDESEDYSNDARYAAAYIISTFETTNLRNYKNELMYAQNYEIVNLRPFEDKLPTWLSE